jgi:hypothetical protein
MSLGRVSTIAALGPAGPVTQTAGNIHVPRRGGAGEAAACSGRCSEVALHCVALHCTALHCTALHCTALHCTALHCTALQRLLSNRAQEIGPVMRALCLDLDLDPRA